MNCIKSTETFTVKKQILIEKILIEDLLCINYHRSRLSNIDLETILIPVLVIDDKILENQKNRTLIKGLADTIKNNTHIATPIPIIFPKSTEKDASRYVNNLRQELEKQKPRKPRIKTNYNIVLDPITRISIRTYLAIFTHLKGDHKVYVEKMRAWKPFEETVNAAANIFWTGRVNPELAIELLSKPTGGPNRPDALALRNKDGKIEALVIDAKLRTLSDKWIERLLSGKYGESLKKYAIYLDNARRELFTKTADSIALLFIFRDEELGVNINPLKESLIEIGYDDVYLYTIKDFIHELDTQ